MIDKVLGAIAYDKETRKYFLSVVLSETEPIQRYFIAEFEPRVNELANQLDKPGKGIIHYYPNGYNGFNGAVVLGTLELIKEEKNTNVDS